MTNRAELLACPFCCGQTVYGTSNGEGSSYIECGNCGASGPVSCGEESDVALWNRRATLGDAELLALANEIGRSAVHGESGRIPVTDSALQDWCERLRAIAAQSSGPAGEAVLELATLIRSGIKTDKGTFFTDRGMAAVEDQLKEVMRAVAQAQPVGLPELPELVEYAMKAFHDCTGPVEWKVKEALRVTFRYYAARAAGVDANSRRYDWIRKNLVWRDWHGSIMWSVELDMPEPSMDDPASDFDKAIDAAISEQAGDKNAT